jgi:hypothetical protein
MIMVVVAITMIVAVMMQMCLAVRQSRVFAEHQRLDRHRHGV